MRLASVKIGQDRRAARADGDELTLLEFTDVGALLEAGIEHANSSGQTVDPRDVEFLPVIPKPGKTICLGLNYASHILETGRPTPQAPTYFAKYHNALTGAFADLPMPAVSTDLDWEAELAIVIGSSARNVDVEHALEHVAGYTVANDVSVRDYQHRTNQWLAGKTFEALTPLGPYLVTADELPPGASGLRISCRVDGTVMQDSNTSDLLFTVADIISDFSRIATLDPGDVILTGTMAGIGHRRDPVVFLEPGQVLETEIEGIGLQRNLVTGR